MLRKRHVIVAAACGVSFGFGGLVALQAPARAADIGIDGSLDIDYGPAKSVQTNNTGFGDNTSSDGVSANGNELDAAYAKVEGGFLKILLTGNISTDFTHLNLFI